MQARQWAEADRHVERTALGNGNYYLGNQSCVPWSARQVRSRRCRLAVGPSHVVSSYSTTSPVTLGGGSASAST